MPADTSQQIAALESRLATQEEVNQLFAQELNKAKEREEYNLAQVREELHKVKEKALKRTETLCPRFISPWFKDSPSGKFSSLPTPVINRQIEASMPLALPHGARLDSISTRGQVTEASSATRIHMMLNLVHWHFPTGFNLWQVEIQTGAGLFTGSKEGLNVTIDNTTGYYTLTLSALWDEPQTAEFADPTIRFHVIEIAYEIPQA